MRAGAREIEDSTGSASGGVATLPTVRARSQAIDWPDKGRGGKPAASYPNARAGLLALGLEFSFDVFADRPLVNGHALGEFAGNFSDKMASTLRQVIVDRYDFDPGKSNVYDAAIQLCLESPFNPVVDRLDALEAKWDGVSRLNTWLTDYAGAENTEIVRAFGRAFLVAAVRRARQPGCKFDFFLMLKGPQGCGKSSLVRILAGDDSVFSDQELVHLQAREQQEAISGKWFIECAELASFSRAGVDRIKAFASRTHDRARPAYGRVQEDRPRGCVFIATTNESTPLIDSTGNRRFWPVTVGVVRQDALRRDRDQLFAEACVIEASGEALGLPERLWSAAASVQAESTEEDPWVDVLRRLRGSVETTVNGGHEERIALRDVNEALELHTSRLSGATAKRVTDAMKALGWQRKATSMKIRGDVVRGYVRSVTDEA